MKREYLINFPMVAALNEILMAHCTYTNLLIPIHHALQEKNNDYINKQCKVA